ncbi:MAG TPA: Holliday junction resolvase RuvX [Candidatus Limnocylindria bacterium]|nr:Holliday junction resolvase RuvX [Candidatus Limnocylindria bacterium]
MSRLLGIDLGARRIGLAVADTETGEIRPLTTLGRASPARDGAVLARLAEEQRIDELVLGLPCNMDGSEGQQAAVTRAWAAEVLPALGLPLSWRDERLTSERAESLVGRPRRGRSGGPPSPAARLARRSSVDREAARLILQAELDARRRPAGSG